MTTEEIYNQIYLKGGHKGEYRKPYNESRYFPMWSQVGEWVKEMNLPVLDIGCGPGQFAELLYDQGHKGYTGVDISSIALQQAPVLRGYNFIHADIMKDSISFDFPVVCMLEILEHIEADDTLVQRMKKGSTIIFSVPNYGGDTHVRSFPGIESVIVRYWPMLKFIKYKTFSQGGDKKIFLCKTIKA